MKALMREIVYDVLIRKPSWRDIIYDLTVGIFFFGFALSLHSIVFGIMAAFMAGVLTIDLINLLQGRKKQDASS
jgi:hypothetical protein